MKVIVVIFNFGGENCVHLRLLLVSFITFSHISCSWPQYTDDLLRDMGLRHGKARTGGNALTWLFKPIEVEVIKDLTKERAALRMQSA